MTAADTKLFMDSFKQIMDEDDDDDDDEDDDKDNGEAKKQKTSLPDQLSNKEALAITFAAFDYFIRRYFDGDVAYINGAKGYGMQVCEKVQELKAEYKERFDASAVIAAFHCL